MADEKTREQYDGLVAKGQALQQKQQSSVPLTGEEISDFEQKHRDTLLKNPVAAALLRRSKNCTRCEIHPEIRQQDSSSLGQPTLAGGPGRETAAEHERLRLRTLASGIMGLGADAAQDIIREPKFPGLNAARVYLANLLHREACNQRTSGPLGERRQATAEPTRRSSGLAELDAGAVAGGCRGHAFMSISHSVLPWFSGRHVGPVWGGWTYLFRLQTPKMAATTRPIT